MRKCLVGSSFLLWSTINTIEGRGSDGFGVRMRMGYGDVLSPVQNELVLAFVWMFEEEELHKELGHWCAVGEVEGEDSV